MQPHLYFKSLPESKERAVRSPVPCITRAPLLPHMVAFSPKDNRLSSRRGIKVAVMLWWRICPSGGLRDRPGDTYLVERRIQPRSPSLPFTQARSLSPDRRGARRHPPQDFGERLCAASMGSWPAPRRCAGKGAAPQFLPPDAFNHHSLSRRPGAGGGYL